MNTNLITLNRKDLKLQKHLDGAQTVQSLLSFLRKFNDLFT